MLNLNYAKFNFRNRIIYKISIIMLTYPNIIINRNSKWRNGFGSQRGPFSIYKALSIATGQMCNDHVPDLVNTEPMFKPIPNENWEKTKNEFTFEVV